MFPHNNGFTTQATVENLQQIILSLQQLSCQSNAWNSQQKMPNSSLNRWNSQQNSTNYPPNVWNLQQNSTNFQSYPWNSQQNSSNQQRDYTSWDHQLPIDINSYINYRSYRNEWSVQFSNKYHQYNYPQIHHIFAAYGRICNIHQTESVDQTTYVNYQTEWDARKCVIGMLSGQSQIVLKRFSKPKMNNSDYFSRNSLPTNNWCYPGQSNETQGGILNTGVVTEKEPSETTDKSSLEYCSSDEKFQPANCRTVRGVTISEVSGEEVQETADSKKLHVNKDDKKADSFVNNDTNKSGKTNQSGSQFFEELLTKYSLKPEILKDSENAKPKEKIAQSEETEKPKILDAHQLVVGNVHENYGIFFILHLLERFEPIYITEMEKMEKPAIRYCHVYFKTAADAEAAEKAYDKTILEDRALIVMRPESLEKEATRKKK
uniref:RRM domain-containing protein n=1 Tax=Bracon brevicornis TaxID=1563983 RepID=A0A6V7I035_9HYME